MRGHGTFAPPPFKPQIEKAIEYYYIQYHGKLWTGWMTSRPRQRPPYSRPGTFVIAAAATPAELAHKAIVETPDLSKMALSRHRSSSWPTEQRRTLTSSGRVLKDQGDAGSGNRN
jgi:hypothetical protein